MPNMAKSKAYINLRKRIMVRESESYMRINGQSNLYKFMKT